MTNIVTTFVVFFQMQLIPVMLIQTLIPIYRTVGFHTSFQCAKHNVTLFKV